MPSNVAKGAYYKARSRKWLMANGYQVADLEIVRWLFTPKGRIPVKRDQFGSDLLAVNESQIVFVQVKGGEAARGNGTFPEARRVFHQFTFPLSAACWVMAWAPGARMPRIVIVTERTGTHVEEASPKTEGRKARQGQAQSQDEWADQNSRPASTRTTLTGTPRHGAVPQRTPR